MYRYDHESECEISSKADNLKMELPLDSHGSKGNFSHTEPPQPELKIIILCLEAETPCRAVPKADTEAAAATKALALYAGLPEYSR